MRITSLESSQSFEKQGNDSERVGRLKRFNENQGYGKTIRVCFLAVKNSFNDEKHKLNLFFWKQNQQALKQGCSISDSFINVYKISALYYIFKISFSTISYP